MEALEEFPKSRTVKIDTVTGTAIMMKTDILKRLTWFTYEERHSWICLTLDKVNEYLQMNANGQRAPELVGEVLETRNADGDSMDVPIASTDLASDDITRLDKRGGSSSRKKKKKKKPANKK